MEIKLAKLMDRYMDRWMDGHKVG